MLSSVQRLSARAPSRSVRRVARRCLPRTFIAVTVALQHGAATLLCLFARMRILCTVQTASAVRAHFLPPTPLPPPPPSPLSPRLQACLRTFALRRHRRRRRFLALARRASLAKRAYTLVPPPPPHAAPSRSRAASISSVTAAATVATAAAAAAATARRFSALARCCPYRECVAARSCAARIDYSPFALFTYRSCCHCARA
jgi:hypothetical protein